MSAYRIIKHIEHQAKGQPYELIISTSGAKRITGKVKSHNEYFVELLAEDDLHLFCDTGMAAGSVFIPLDRIDTVVPKWL